MNLSASDASGDGCKSRGFEGMTPHCAVCRCNGCGLSRCAQLLLFLNSGWQMLHSFKLGGIKAVPSVGKPSSRAPISHTCQRYPASGFLLDLQFLSQVREPLSASVCTEAACTKWPHCLSHTNAESEAWLVVQGGALPSSLIPVPPHRAAHRLL